MKKLIFILIITLMTSSVFGYTQEDKRQLCHKYAKSLALANDYINRVSPLKYEAVKQKYPDNKILKFYVDYTLTHYYQKWTYQKDFDDCLENSTKNDYNLQAVMIIIQVTNSLITSLSK